MSKVISSPKVETGSSTRPCIWLHTEHAEMTAMINLKAKEHPNVKLYTLYTTMEPCPMCFGTMVMMGIRNLRYAARDGFAGATELNDRETHIKGKSMFISRRPRIRSIPDLPAGHLRKT